MKSLSGARLVCAVVLAGCVTAACSGGQSDLQKWIAETKKKPGGRIKPLREVKPYETFVYDDQGLRSPFVPSQASGFNSVRRDTKRAREFLEQFSLDTLRMVGSIKLGGTTYALVETKDGIVHRVTVGNYMGQNDGRITDISPSKIDLTEIVPDGLGGYMKRQAGLSLSQ